MMNTILCHRKDSVLLWSARYCVKGDSLISWRAHSCAMEKKTVSLGK
jgi:hypothetical protein